MRKREYFYLSRQFYDAAEINGPDFALRPIMFAAGCVNFSEPVSPYAALYKRTGNFANIQRYNLLVTSAEALSASVPTFTLIALAEIGDKSQLVCMTLAAFYHGPRRYVRSTLINKLLSVDRE